MAKRVYFAFHYQDVCDFRAANVVRNHWMTKPHREAAGFFDASLWEDAKKHGDIAIKRLHQLRNRRDIYNLRLDRIAHLQSAMGFLRDHAQLQAGQFHSRGSHQLDYREGQENETSGPQPASLSWSDIHGHRTHGNPSQTKLKGNG